MVASGVKALKYDVFLNFIDEDTRNSFTDHLYHRLKRARISTFMGDEEINTGEELKPEIQGAIEESRGSIVVLSKNYATSSRCLDELLHILEQRSKGKHFVLPVFYGVQPTDVRDQKGTFDIQVQPSSEWTEVKVNNWKAALMQVANLTGVIVSGPETIILKKIVDQSREELDR